VYTTRQELLILYTMPFSASMHTGKLVKVTLLPVHCMILFDSVCEKRAAVSVSTAVLIKTARCIQIFQGDLDVKSQCTVLIQHSILR
jgi:hypothetical protein